jgi:hypothetical protein
MPFWEAVCTMTSPAAKADADAKADELAAYAYA